MTYQPEIVMDDNPLLDNPRLTYQMPFIMAVAKQYFQQLVVDAKNGHKDALAVIDSLAVGGWTPDDMCRACDDMSRVLDVTIERLRRR